MQVPEKLGAFYLGREVDPDTGEDRAPEALISYDARDLTTHAVCVGMTGSGKTGLCIDLLEEAALDKVPAILIDPKGDIGNLLLTFPELRPADFEPWVNLDDARRKDLSVADYAAKMAATWKQGLADWGQGPERIQRLRDAAEFRLLTPGSEAGLPVSILASLRAPAGATAGSEALRDQVRGTVSALLGLVGVEADPLQSREHILLSQIMERAWTAGEDLDLARLITSIQEPPLRKLGVFDLETVFPAKDRFGLAMAFNNLVASPAFGAWLTGEPLDVDALLTAPDGRPRHSIFSIAHLGESERMFFVTLLLEQVLAWVRRQPGTTSLRALLYIDEVFGYLPPVANPPSKTPLLTLLKQARASGLGVVLTTQNPVDLDYKALSNAGTWMIGKLQTDRDKQRVLDGLEGAAGAGWDRARADALIGGLGSRVFLLHNVHADGPLLFRTRWAMSYLRGPLTREQIARLKPADAKPASAPAPPTAAPAATATAYDSVVPALAPGRAQAFLPVRISAREAEAALRVPATREEAAPQLVYEPALLALGAVSFVDTRRAVDETRPVARLIAAADLGVGLDWAAGDTPRLAAPDLDSEPAPARFGTVPAELAKATEIKRLERDFKDWLYREQGLDLLTCPPLKLQAEPGEEEAAFRGRVRQAQREARDAEVAKLRDKLNTQLDRLQTRLDRERRELEEDRMEYSSRKREELLSVGETLVGMLGLFGRKSRRSLSGSVTKHRMTGKAKLDIAESEAEITRLEAEIESMREDFERESAAIAARWEATAASVETRRIKPRRSDLRVDYCELAWVPYWEFAMRDAAGRPALERVPAWRGGAA